MMHVVRNPRHTTPADAGDRDHCFIIQDPTAPISIWRPQQATHASEQRDVGHGAVSHSICNPKLDPNPKPHHLPGPCASKSTEKGLH